MFFKSPVKHFVLHFELFERCCMNKTLLIDKNWQIYIDMNKHSSDIWGLKVLLEGKNCRMCLFDRFSRD